MARSRTAAMPGGDLGVPACLIPVRGLVPRYSVAIALRNRLVIAWSPKRAASRRSLGNFVWPTPAAYPISVQGGYLQT